MIGLLLRFVAALLSFTFSLALTCLFYYQNQWPTYNEAQARDGLVQIGKAQILYLVTKGKGQFTNLETLGREGMIDSELASGEKDGYLFTCEPVIVKGKAVMFDAKAKPKRSGIFRSGNRSYYSNEIPVVWEREGSEPPGGTIENRKPKDGYPARL